MQAQLAAEEELGTHVREASGLQREQAAKEELFVEALRALGKNHWVTNLAKFLVLAHYLFHLEKGALLDFSMDEAKQWSRDVVAWVRECMPGSSQELRVSGQAFALLQHFGDIAAAVEVIRPVEKLFRATALRERAGASGEACKDLPFLPLSLVDAILRSRGIGDMHPKGKGKGISVRAK